MNQYLIASFEQMLKEDPKSRVFLRLAEEYRKGGEHEKAVEVCESGLVHHPNYIPALVCLGRCHESLGRFEQAETVFKQVLQTAPDNPHALRGLGNMLYESGSLAEALDYFETLSIHEPTDESIRGRIRQIQERLIDPVIDQPSERFSVPEETDLDVSIDDEEPELPDTPLENMDGIDEDLETSREPPEPEEPLRTPTDTALDDLDSSFERAVREADDLDDEVEAMLLEDPEDPASELGTEDEQTPSDGEVQPRELDRETTATAPRLTEDEIEARLTLGLKHEKMEHLEEATRIYRSLLGSAPNDPTVRDHLSRVEQRLKGESKKEKKMRVLSNFLDKVKGGFDVPDAHR